MRKGDLSLRFFTTIATLGTPQDITVQEIRIESFFPMDEPTSPFLASAPLVVDKSAATLH